ncbi:MAG: hypothetical protein KAZ18_03010 [Acinetobacter sp.]|nr:hypothetical protein [Acinetobacter sp.]
MSKQENQPNLSSEQSMLSLVLEQNNQILNQHQQLLQNQNDLIGTIKTLVQINVNQSAHIQELICLITDEPDDDKQPDSLDD